MKKDNQMRNLSLSVIVGLGLFCLRAEPVSVRVDSGERDLTPEEKAAISGATFVKGGTLKVAHDQALPVGGAILLGDRGVLDMDGRHLPAGSTVALADPQAFADHDRSFTLMDHVVDDITVTNADQLPGNWTVRVVNGKLRANSGKGMLIYFR